jgi:putative component of toxin-antitoxin plasmid stabilization module
MERRLELIELMINGMHGTAVREGIYELKIASYNKYRTEYMLQNF